jgi:predicted ATPase
VQKEIIVIIGGPGTGKTTIINELMANGYCCYPEISRQVTLDAQKQGIEQLFLENPLLFSKLLLEGRKKQFDNACNEPHNVVFLDRGFLMYWHICIILAIATPLFLMKHVERIFIPKSLFYLLGKQFMLVTKSAMKTLNKRNFSLTISQKHIKITAMNSLKYLKIV